jgi:hypothetical protein
MSLSIQLLTFHASVPAHFFRNISPLTRLVILLLLCYLQAYQAQQVRAESVMPSLACSSSLNLQYINL